MALRFAACVRPQSCRARALRAARLRADEHHDAQEPAMNRHLSPALRIALNSAAFLFASWAGAARADDPNDPQVVPYRPTVSTPAQLSAPGWLELEAGGLVANGPAASASRATLPYTLKLAFTPDWGVRIGGDAWVRD